MNITPTNTPAPKYPALAALAVAAMALPACQQQVAGEAPRDIQPLTVSYVDENGNIIRSVETTQAEWKKSRPQLMGGSMPVENEPREAQRTPGRFTPGAYEQYKKEHSAR